MKRISRLLVRVEFVFGYVLGSQYDGLYQWCTGTVYFAIYFRKKKEQYLQRLPTPPKFHGWAGSFCDCTAQEHQSRLSCYSNWFRSRLISVRIRSCISFLRAEITLSCISSMLEAGCGEDFLFFLDSLSYFGSKAILHHCGNGGRLLELSRHRLTFNHPCSWGFLMRLWDLWRETLTCARYDCSALIL